MQVDKWKKLLFSLTNGRKSNFLVFAQVLEFLIKMGKDTHRVNRYYALFLIVYSINRSGTYQHNDAEEQNIAPLVLVMKSSLILVSEEVGNHLLVDMSFL